MKAINAIRIGIFPQIHHIRRPNVVGEYGVSIGCEQHRYGVTQHRYGFTSSCDAAFSGA
jgi:hypothetical protein